jgi:prepilin-type N-terminal cleavage/methylation domain-containing protein
MDINTEETKDQGFTLVELLIVIVILGILAAVTVFAVRGITDSAEEATCDTEKATVQTAAEAYFVQNNETYPASVGVLQGTYLRELPSQFTSITINSTTGLVSGTCV